MSYTKKAQNGHRFEPRRRRVLAPVIAAAAALGVAGALVQPAAASPAVGVGQPAAVSGPGTSVARWGAGYLARQISVHGGHLDSFGVTDVVDTAYAVLDLHAAGVG